MTQAWRVIFASIVLSLSLAAPSAAGPLEDAAAAFVNGDYVTAQRQFRVLADQGNAVAQYNLGTMYFGGKGVQQDFRRGVEMVSPCCGPRARRR